MSEPENEHRSFWIISKSIGLSGKLRLTLIDDLFQSEYNTNRVLLLAKFTLYLPGSLAVVCACHLHKVN